MPWQVVYRADLQFVETSYRGNMLAEELRAAFDETVALGRTHNAQRYLGDCTALQGGHSIVDLYELAKLMAGLVPPGFKEAVLLPQLTATLQDVQFWETACFNLGLLVRVFADRAAAVAWLCDNDAPQ